MAFSQVGLRLGIKILERYSFSFLFTLTPFNSTLVVKCFYTSLRSNLSALRKRRSHEKERGARSLRERRLSIPWVDSFLAFFFVGAFHVLFGKQLLPNWYLPEENNYLNNRRIRNRACSWIRPRSRVRQSRLNFRKQMFLMKTARLKIRPRSRVRQSRLNFRKQMFLMKTARRKIRPRSRVRQSRLNFRKQMFLMKTARLK